MFIKNLKLIVIHRLSLVWQQNTILDAASCRFTASVHGLSHDLAHGWGRDGRSCKLRALDRHVAYRAWRRDLRACFGPGRTSEALLLPKSQ